MFKGRLGRLQRQCHYAFIALDGEARTSHLAEWCRPELVILELRGCRLQTTPARPGRLAPRVRREGGWRLEHSEPES
jgi:hypothetical protein